MVELFYTKILNKVNVQNLTAKQREIFSFLKNFYSEFAKAPTLQEISEITGIDSRAGVLYHLKKLEEAGFISRTSQKRGIILKDSITFSRVPILGIANAGQPLMEAQEDRLGVLEIDSRLLRNRGNLFAVKISGDSMNRERVGFGDTEVLLRNGNFVIVDRESEYKEGDVVLAVINGGATVKKLWVTENSIVLSPNSSNDIHQPTYIMDGGDLFINGKVVLALEKRTS